MNDGPRGRVTRVAARWRRWQRQQAEERRQPVCCPAAEGQAQPLHFDSLVCAHAHTLLPTYTTDTLLPLSSNECKRRKIKCNGESPCQRCGNLVLECVYAPNCCTSNFRDTDEFRTMSAQIASLQGQVDALFTTMNTLRTEFANQHQHQHQPPIDPYLQQQSSLDQIPSLESARAKPRQRRSTFRGPTSMEFNLGVANSHLENMGIAPSSSENDVLREESPVANAISPIPLHATKDPIWHLDRNEALRLVRVYQDDMHMMYPLVSIPELVEYANKLFNFMEAAQRTGLMMRDFPGADAIDDEETNVLKIVMATAMVVEGSGKSDLGRAMYAYVQPSIDALLLGDTGLRGVQLLALTVSCTRNVGKMWLLTFTGHVSIPL
jgi:hypothetical protein